VSLVTRRALLPASIRGRFLLVVFFAAVVPLALIGVWLTQSVVRAGEDLLRSELDQSLQRVAAGVETRWSYRSGDLALLTNNEVARRLLAGAQSKALTAEDSQYFDQLVVSLAHTIPSFEYRDAAGGVRWSASARLVDTTEAEARDQHLAPSLLSPTRPAGPTGPTLTVRLPIAGSRGGNVPLGALIARVDLASLIAIDTSLRLPNGAKLQLVQRGTGQSLLPAFAPDSLLGRNRFTANGVDWLAVQRPLVDPDITLIMAAPLGGYVEPFEHVARTGAITLAVVALFALALSAWLTTRLTASIERLAVAADAVARGDLNHRVEGTGAGEVGRLAAAFNSMTESLRQTLTELTKRQALAAVGEYAASLAHQVRNGLTAVRVDLQRAQEKTTNETPGRPLIDRALENVKRLDGTLSGSLRTARSRHAPHRRVDLRSVLRSAAQMAEGSFNESGSTCDLVAPGGHAVWVLGDALALEQLFLNLLLNSAQALPRGARAAIALDVEGSELRVVVSDTGGGISAGDLEHVLDPFFSTKADGTGLGLPIARQIAAAHGGSLRIESVPGEGTRVEVRLPLSAAPS
jgi:signal transduction histidine kinase